MLVCARTLSGSALTCREFVGDEDGACSSMVGSQDRFQHSERARHCFGHFGAGDERFFTRTLCPATRVVGDEDGLLAS